MKSFFFRFFKFLNVDIAMDLGTANTLLYTRKHGIVINEPSVVAFDSRDGKILAIGAEARSYIGRVPKKVRSVRPLKDGVIADFDVTSAMITQFVRRCVKGLALVKPSMVICVPTGITQVEKKAVIDAAAEAGARDVALIEEPMAAALGANLPIGEPVGNLVLDIGGGTSEVAVISLNGVVVSRSARIAGDAMNQAVRRYLREVFHLDVGENTAENVKILLGSALPQDNAPSLEVSGKDVAQGGPKTVRVGEGHVREAIAECARNILRALMETLDATPPELAADISRNGMLLAGGGSLLKNLDVYLARETGLKVILDNDPLTTVLRGTARAMLDRDAFRTVFIN